MTSNKKLKTLFFVTCIVAAELTAFTFLQKSLDSKKNEMFHLISAILLFGLVVPLAFRETLRGNPIAIANLYWIIASAIGSVIIGYWVFKQTLSTKDFIAIGLLIIATLVQFYGNSSS